MLRPAACRRAGLSGLAVFALFISAVGSGVAAGPEVGEIVPAFEAADHSGQVRDFDSLAGERGLLLLFFRSADW